MIDLDVIERNRIIAEKSAEIASLAAQNADLRERLAAAESREVCTVAHDNVDTCGYCQRDALAARLAAAERERDKMRGVLRDVRTDIDQFLIVSALARIDDALERT